MAVTADPQFSHFRQYDCTSLYRPGGRRPAIHAFGTFETSARKKGQAPPAKTDSVTADASPEPCQPKPPAYYPCQTREKHR